MNNKTLKSNNAITLIALIITIIVLLILAMVSIKLILDGGIITRAQNATSKYTVEQEKELIQIGYSEYKMEKYSPEEKEELPEGVAEDLEKLRTNFVNKSLEDVYDEEKSTAGIEVLVSGDLEISIKSGNLTTDDTYAYALFEYNGYTYKMTIDETEIIKNIEFQKIEKPKKEIVLKVEGADVVGNEIIGWNITFNETKHEYFLNGEGQITNETETNAEELDLLERYFLGEAKTGVSFSSIMNDDGTTFKNNEIIENASKDLLIAGFGAGTGSDDEKCDIQELYIKYKNKAMYKLVCDKNSITESISLQYRPRGREGQKIEYDETFSGRMRKGEWTILYDYGDSVEILAPEACSEVVKINGREGYNNIISVMNNSLYSSDDAISVRCAGSNPKNPNEDVVPFWTPEEGECPYQLKREDTNYNQDFARIFYYGIADVRNHNDTDFESYWIPSRSCYYNDQRADFYLKRYDKGRFYEEYVVGLDKVGEQWNIYEQYLGQYGNKNYQVRPIVKISEDLIK